MNEAAAILTACEIVRAELRALRVDLSIPAARSDGSEEGADFDGNGEALE